jgi:hypothetical protein
MARKQIYSKASDVWADDGVVNVDGPDGVDVGLTPERLRARGTELVVLD